MAKIRIVGDSSGYVEIAAPNAAGNNTLELPSGNTRLVGSDSAGNVSISGIVTAATFSGNVNSTGISTFTSGIVVSAGTTAAPSISPTGDSNTGIFFPSADTVCIGEGGSEVFRVNSSGNIGINNTNPLYPLHINGNSGTLLRLDGGGSTGTRDVVFTEFGTDAYGGIIRYDSVADLFTFGTLENSVVKSAININRASGIVTTPHQPAANWSIAVNTSTGVRTLSTKRDVNNNVSSVAAGNGSSHGSVGRFTAPVSGVYLITIRGTGTTISGSNELLSVYGSWSTTTNVLNPTNEVLDLRCTPLINDGIGWSCTLYLSTNDYWELDWYRPVPTGYLGTTVWDISTILLG